MPDFNLDITLKTNSELPVIGTDKKALLLDGSGTYSYTVTITTITTGSQEVPALFEKAWADSTITRVITFTSTRNVVLYTSSKAIDSSKPVIAYDNGIENLETTGVILEFTSPSNQASGTSTLYSKIVWEDKQEKEETNTTDISMDASGILENASKIYFKYPNK